MPVPRPGNCGTSLAASGGCGVSGRHMCRTPHHRNPMYLRQRRAQAPNGHRPGDAEGAREGAAGAGGVQRPVAGVGRGRSAACARHPLDDAQSHPASLRALGLPAPDRNRSLPSRRRRDPARQPRQRSAQPARGARLAAARGRAGDRRARDPGRARILDRAGALHRQRGVLASPARDGGGRRHRPDDRRRDRRRRCWPSSPGRRSRLSWRDRSSGSPAGP